MAAIKVPHFDLPFRLVANHAVVAEQDTIEDVSNCVEAIIRTTKGERNEILDFGIEDLTFWDQPLKLQDILESVFKHEPRAALVIEQIPDRFDNLIAHIAVKVSLKREVTRV